MLVSFFQRERKLIHQARELKQLRLELENLRLQNESMRQGMRRCISCEYRLESKEKNNA
jgi:uncharacterized protein with PIN domain